MRRRIVIAVSWSSKDEGNVTRGVKYGCILKTDEPSQPRVISIFLVQSSYKNSTDGPGDWVPKNKAFLGCKKGRRDKFSMLKALVHSQSLWGDIVRKLVTVRAVVLPIWPQRS
jgi:hypothetical protein